MSRPPDLVEHREHREDEEDELQRDTLADILNASDGQAAERERMKLLLAHFDEDQMARYEAFRRANVNRNAVKKLANSIVNQSITANVSVALSGMSKVLVGEIVERARDIQQLTDAPSATGEPEPLRPEHLREAWRQYKLETGAVPGTRWHSTGDNGHFLR